MGNFLADCMADLQTTEVAPFQETFCKRCKNPKCDQAQWAADRFGQRVASQAARLLNPEHQLTNIGDIKRHPKYAILQDFVDMTREAIRLESSARRGDWSVDPSTEKPRVIVPPSFEVQPPKEQTPEEILAEDVTKEALVEATLKGIQSEEGPAPVTEPAPAPPSPPTKWQAMPPAKNLPKPPQEGIMVGGGPILPPPKPVDPWAPKTDTVPVVAPGARIKMGGGKP